MKKVDETLAGKKRVKSSKQAEELRVKAKAGVASVAKNKRAKK